MTSTSTRLNLVLYKTHANLDFDLPQQMSIIVLYNAANNHNFPNHEENGGTEPTIILYYDEHILLII